MILIGVFMVIGMIVGGRLKSKMKKYSKMPIQAGLSGASIAQKMLEDSGINDVKITQGKGFLTDHYNPANKTISLSPDIYQGHSVAAAAVAAHETGHAIQHAKGYKWLEMRSKLVPVVQFGSQFYFWVIIAGFAMNFIGLVWLGIALFGASTLFSFVTLPVEYDASNRALRWLNNTNLLTPKEHAGAKDGLKWAARTYVVAALASVAQLLYWIMRAND